MTTLILAGTDKEFQEYVDFLPKPRSQYKQIKGLSDLRGLYGRDIVLIGTYYERPDWLKIVDYLSLANFQYKEL